MTPVSSATRVRVAAVMTLLCAGALACKADSVTSARTFGTLRFSETDPIGDTLANVAGSPQPAFDLTTTNVRFKGDSLIFSLHFTGSVLRSGTDNSVLGYVDIDVDQNPGTGGAALADGVGGSSGMGVDYRLHFSAGDNGARLEDATGKPLLLLPARFDGDSAVIKVARTQLNLDDGNFDFSVLVYTLDRDMDFAPNDGHYVVDATATVLPGAVAAPGRLARPPR